MMKKTFFMSAVALLFVCCNSKENVADLSSAVPFDAGQKVALRAGMPSKGETAPNRVAGQNNPAENCVDYVWEEADEIGVIVDGKTAVFAMKEGSTPGSAMAEFEGIMPAKGNTFDVIYPLTAKDLANQNYVPEGIESQLMKMEAFGCSLESTIQLVPANGVMILPMVGQQKVSKAVLKNLATNDTYTLNCGEGVQLNEENATNFFFVVPINDADESVWENGFSVELKDADGATINTISNTKSRTFAKGEALVFPTVLSKISAVIAEDIEVKASSQQEMDLTYTISPDGIYEAKSVAWTKVSGSSKISVSTAGHLTIQAITTNKNAEAVLKVTVDGIITTCNVLAYNYTEYDYGDEVPEYVTLGNNKWVSKNLGAENPEDLGNYYAFADINGHVGGSYSFNTTNYNNTDAKSIGTQNIPTKSTRYDAAYALNTNWQMPSGVQINDLATNSALKWQYVDGAATRFNHSSMKGFIVHTNNASWQGNKEFIFLPISGAYADENNGKNLINGQNASSIELQMGSYWCRTQNGEGNGYYLRFYRTSQGRNMHEYTTIAAPYWAGLPIRPVYIGN